MQRRCVLFVSVCTMAWHAYGSRGNVECMRHGRLT